MARPKARPPTEGAPSTAANVDVAPRVGSADQDDIKYSAPALEKGLDILEALADEAASLSLSEVAQRVGRSVNEIFRMVQTLQRRGWVMVERGDRYRLSLRMFELAHRQRPLRSLVESALPLMQDVSRELMQSCHLSVAESGRVMIVAQTDSPGLLSFSARTGAVLNPFNTSSGHVLLAFRTPDERARLIEAHVALHADTDQRRTSLLEGLETVRRQGYAQEKSEQTFGVTNIGFPVFDRSGNVQAAMVIPFLESLDGGPREAQLERGRHVLGRAARDLSRRLGYVAPPTELASQHGASDAGP